MRHVGALPDDRRAPRRRKQHRMPVPPSASSPADQQVRSAQCLPLPPPAPWSATAPVEASELRETGRPKHGIGRCFQLLPVGRFAHFAGKLAPIRGAGHGVQWPQSPQQTFSAKPLAPALPRNLIRRPRRPRRPSIGSDVRAWNAESNSWLNGAPGRRSNSVPIRALRLQCRAKDTPARCTPRAA
jgi:hypothetical protein